jgi:hypothetical protein
MAAVSLGKALGSGFALIRERPASVFAWGLLLVVFVEVPVFAILGQAIVGLAGAWGQKGPVNPVDASNLAFAFQQRIAIVEAMMLPTLLARALIVAAVYRAVLEPQRRGLAYLRIGRQEGWLMLLSLTVSVLAGFAIIPVELLIGGSILLGMALQSPWSLIAPIATGVAGLIFLLWVYARLSLAAPMTFAERNFRLFESWRATRRHGLELLGLGLVLFLLLVLIEVVVFGLVGIGAMAAIAGRTVDVPSVMSWLKDLSLQSPGQLAVWLVPTGLVAAAVIGAVNAIAIAPWASAYQQLNQGPAARA